MKYIRHNGKNEWNKEIDQAVILLCTFILAIIAVA